MQEMDEGESPYTVVTLKVMRNNQITNLYPNTHQLLLHEPKARRKMHVSSYVNDGVSNVLTYADLYFFNCTMLLYLVTEVGFIKSAWRVGILFIDDLPA